MHTKQKDSPKLLKRRIQVLEGYLAGALPGSGWTSEKVRRKAFHRVYAEDVLQEKPQPVADPVLKAAMDLWRAKHKSDETDYPESARKRHEESKSNPLPDFLRRTPKTLTPEQQERLDTFKGELLEGVNAIINENCDDTSLELSDEERTVVSSDVDKFMDELLRKKVDDLESEDSKDRISEQISDYVRGLIQKSIDERQEGA